MSPEKKGGDNSVNGLCITEKVTREEQVKLRKQRRETARATTKGQEGVGYSPRGARKSLWLENLIGNELDGGVGAEEG